MTTFDDFLNSASDADQESWFADQGSEMQKSLHKLRPACPQCSREDTALVDSSTRLAQWRCAHCEHYFLVAISQAQCPHCAIKLQPGKAMQQTYTGVPDFPGDEHPVTLSAGGQGMIVDCLKCPDCGYTLA